MTRVILSLSCVWLAGAASVRAADLEHRVLEGETLATIASRYYGEPTLAESLRIYNEMGSATAEVGGVLRVPVAVEHAWGSADSWPLLARTHWGDATLFHELRQLASGAAAEPAPGERVLIPVLVPYRIRRGQTLASLSRLTFGTPRHALVLARVNRIDDPEQLAAGALLQLPLPHTARASASESAPASAQRYAGELARAAGALDSGDFETVLELLERMEPRVLESGTWLDRVRLLEQLTFAYVAFDRPSDACRSYRALRRNDPTLRWDPEQVSPKIIRMTRGC